MRRFSIAALLALGVAIAAFADSTPQGYTPTLLTSRLGRAAYPYAINNAGAACGTFDTGTVDSFGLRLFHAFVTAGGRVVELPTLGEPGLRLQATAHGLSNRGDVVGASQIGPGGFPHAFLYRGGRMTDLGYELQAGYSVASAVNDSGQVVGTFGDDPGTAHAFLWSADRGGVDLGPGAALGINNAGHVVGYSRSLVFGTTTPYLFKDANRNGQVDEDEIVQLPTLGEEGANSAIGIADGDRVAGQVVDAQGVTHAALWSPGKKGFTLNDLGDFGLHSGATASAISSDGRVVGFADGQPFLYQNGTLISLNPLLPAQPSLQLQTLTGVNARGQIAATALVNNQSPAAGLLLAPSVRPTGTADLLALWSGTPRATQKRGVWTVTGTLQVQNAGAREAAASHVQIALSVDGTTPLVFNEKAVAVLLTEPAIPGNGFAKLNVKITVPAGVDPRLLYVIATVDADEKVLESNEANNVAVSAPIL